MKKYLAGLLTALMLSSATSAFAATIPATDITSVDSTTPAGASLSEGTARVTWQDNHDGAYVYSVAAVSAGSPTRFGSSPVCDPSGSCSSNLIQLSGGVNYDVYLTVVDPSTGDSGQKSLKFLAHTVSGSPVVQAPTTNGADVTLNWAAPSNLGGAGSVASYTITGGASPVTVQGNLTSYVMQNLTYGQAYSFSIVATNNIGNSVSASFSSVTPVGKPDAPAAPTTSTSDTTVTVNWTAPAANGSAITGYKVYLVNGANGLDVGQPTTATASATHIEITGVSAGTYTAAVVATNGKGDSARSTSSAAFTVVPNVAPAVTTANVRGIAKVGQTLSVTAGGVTGVPTPTETYQWKRGSNNISGATASSYTLVAGDLGAAISVVVTETNSLGSANVTSEATAVVTAADASPAIASASISGTAKVGQVLTASAGMVTGSPTPTPTYQWKRNGVNIAGATSASYALVVADLAATITVVITESNGVGSSASATSSATAPVAAADAAPTITSVSVTGTPTEGNSLQSSVVGTAGSPVAVVTYQWLRAGVAISGATAVTYTLVTADVGAAISVRVTYTNLVSAVTLTSSATAAVAALTPPPSGGSSGSGGSGSSGSSGASGSSGGGTVTPPVTPTVDTRPTQDTRPPVTPTVDTRPPAPVVVAPNQAAAKTVDARQDTVISITISGDGTTPALSGVQLTLPAGQASDGAKVSVVPIGSLENLVKGIVTLNIQITDAAGAKITSFSKPLSLVLGKLNLNGLALVFSTDGLTWHEIAKIAGPDLPAGSAEGYFVDASGNVVVLTTHLTYFATKARQAALVVSPTKSLAFVGETVLISVSGGAGSGASTLAVKDASICSLNGSALALKAAGTCEVTATKLGDNAYLDAASASASVTVVSPSLKLTWVKSKAVVLLTAGAGYAQAKAVLQYRKQGSTTWRLLASVKLDQAGSLKGKFAVPAKAQIRVLVGGVALVGARG